MNNKLKIRLYDTNFSHHPNNSSISSFPGHDVFSEHIEWIRDESVQCDIAFFTDNCLEMIRSHKHKYNFAWIIEPRKLIPAVYDQISNPDLYNKFDNVLTYDGELLSIDDKKFVQYVFGGCWIKPNDQRCYPKTKNICIIASHKTQLEGHRLRHEIINKYSKKHNIDVYGNGYNRFDQTVDVIKDYRYCIVVENCNDSFWVTEKLIQCFRTGTIPIYWGSAFNKKILFSDKYGFYRFYNIEQLDKLLPLMTENLYEYEAMEEQINRNFYYAERFNVCEDWIYDWFLWPWMEDNKLLKVYKQ